MLPILPPPHTLTGASQRLKAGLLGDLFRLRAPDRVWEDCIHIAELHFNTEVPLYKLLTRHRELSGCGPKLK